MKAESFNSTKHHFHQVDGKGGQCAECHMPTRTYMGVDDRHDHSMRIPRPDLSATLGTPNSCTNCHSDKKADWASRWVRQWYPKPLKGLQNYAATFARARQQAHGIDGALAAIAMDNNTPAIARATAVSELSRYPGPEALATIEGSLQSTDPAIRTAAVAALENSAATLRVSLLFPMLSDPRLSVRAEAARVLADIPAGSLPIGQKKILQKAMADYLKTQQVNADRPEAMVNLGNFQRHRGNLKEAEANYKKAILLSAHFIPSYINLSDLYKSLGDPIKAQETLQRAIKVEPDSAAPHHALGLHYVRAKQIDLALEELKQAVRLEPDVARYVYVYGVALNSVGRTDQALKVLTTASERFPNNINILNALVVYYQQAGNQAAAARFQEKLNQPLPRR